MRVPAFEPTRRDERGLERLMDQIHRDRGKHEGYHVQCFNDVEADWIRRRLLAWRRDLDERLFFSWYFRVR